MKSGNAFFAGVVGGTVMSLLMTIGRARGVPVDFELLLGTFSGATPGPNEWISGFILSLWISGAVGTLYGAGFERLARQATWRTGVLFSFVHMAIGGLLLGFMTAIHPLVPHAIADPGAFLANLGPSGWLLFIGTHVLYGAIVGSLYAPSQPQRSRVAA